MVQFSSASDHEVRAAQGWDGEVQTALEKETQQRLTNLELPQGKLRSNLHKVREREQLLLLSQIISRNIYSAVELCSQQCVTKMSGTITAKPPRTCQRWLLHSKDSALYLFSVAFVKSPDNSFLRKQASSAREGLQFSPIGNNINFNWQQQLLKKEKLVGLLPSPCFATCAELFIPRIMDFSLF